MFFLLPFSSALETERKGRAQLLAVLDAGALPPPYLNPYSSNADINTYGNDSQ